MLSATLQHVGTKYLQMTLRKIVHEVCMNNPRLEIDPLKYLSHLLPALKKLITREGALRAYVLFLRIKPEENYDENLKRLVSYCELFFNTITKSLEDCPVYACSWRRKQMSRLKTSLAGSCDTFANTCRCPP